MSRSPSPVGAVSVDTGASVTQSLQHLTLVKILAHVAATHAERAQLVELIGPGVGAGVAGVLGAPRLAPGAATGSLQKCYSIHSFQKMSS